MFADDKTVVIEISYFSYGNNYVNFYHFIDFPVNQQMLG